MMYLGLRPRASCQMRESPCIRARVLDALEPLLLRTTTLLRSTLVRPTQPTISETVTSKSGARKYRITMEVERRQMCLYAFTKGERDKTLFLLSIICRSELEAIDYDAIMTLVAQFAETSLYRHTNVNILWFAVDDL